MSSSTLTKKEMNYKPSNLEIQKIQKMFKKLEENRKKFEEISKNIETTQDHYYNNENSFSKALISLEKLRTRNF